MLGNPNTPQGERSLEDTEKESEEEGAAAGAAEEVWMEAVLGKGHGRWGAWPCLGLRPTAWTGKSWLQVGIPGPWAARWSPTNFSRSKEPAALVLEGAMWVGERPCLAPCRLAASIPAHPVLGCPQLALAGCQGSCSCSCCCFHPAAALCLGRAGRMRPSGH